MSRWLLFVLNSLTVACATGSPPPAPPDVAEVRRCLATLSWLDRVEGGRAVWIDPDGGERVVEGNARSPPPPEGEVEVDGHPSPICAARLRVYQGWLRDRRVRASDNARDVLIW